MVALSDLMLLGAAMMVYCEYRGLPCLCGLTQPDRRATAVAANFEKGASSGCGQCPLVKLQALVVWQKSTDIGVGWLWHGRLPLISLRVYDCLERSKPVVPFLLIALLIPG